MTVMRIEQNIPSTPSQKMSVYRAKLRAQGLRPVQVWLPDTRKKEFVKEAKRQSLMLQGSMNDDEITEWLEQAADTEGWE